MLCIFEKINFGDPVLMLGARDSICPSAGKGQYKDKVTRFYGKTSDNRGQNFPKLPQRKNISFCFNLHKGSDNQYANIDCHMYHPGTITHS